MHRGDEVSRFLSCPVVSSVGNRTRKTADGQGMSVLMLKTQEFHEPYKRRSQEVVGAGLGLSTNSVYQGQKT